MTTVNVYPADDGGCGFYRLLEPARVLRVAGYDIDVIAGTDPQHRQIHAEAKPRTPGVISPLDPVVAVQVPNCDIAVFQRPLFRQAVEIIAAVQRGGIKVVVEIDDDFHALHPLNVVNETFDAAHNPAHLKHACDIADLVTVTTPALARRYGSHGRVAILPNLVPARYLNTEAPKSGYLGWAGGMNTHPEDLQVCGTGIRDALTETGAPFAVIGTGWGVRKALQLPTKPLACGWITLEKYPDAVAHLDAGIVPLAPSPFNEAKSWLKGLEMAAVGVPFVASPTSDYRALHDLGVGELAATPAEWAKATTALLTDEPRRLDLAGRYRQIVAGLTYEERAGDWWQAWTSVL